MILDDKELKGIKNTVIVWEKSGSHVDVIKNLLDTISDKDTQIQQLQQKLVACENIMKSVLDNLYCMLPCGTAKDTQYGRVAVDSLEKALEALERMD